VSEANVTARLRRTGEADLDFVVGAENDLENRSFVLPWSREQHRAALSDPDIEHCIVEENAGRRPVGCAILMGVRSPHQSIEFRRLVITEKGKGYGRAVLRLVKDLAFQELGAHRLWLDVMDHNQRARALYESEGFIVEGTLRECIRVDGDFRSLILLSMLRREYWR
jgi:RimJ/RimL family protein N-acetyltransferase